jgi:hypothetical protein
VLKFVEDKVIGKNDNMKKKRKKFRNEHLYPPNGQIASKNIFEHINRELKYSGEL